MSTPTFIIDTKTGRSAKVTSSRGLAVSPPQASLAYNATLEVDDIVANIVPGKGGEIFCITGIVLTGNKNISTTVDAVVDIYEANSPTSATVITTLLTIPVARSSQTVLTSILLETSEGSYINGKTSDDDVLVTILGFYIEN